MSHRRSISAFLPPSSALLFYYVVRSTSPDNCFSSFSCFCFAPWKTDKGLCIDMGLPGAAHGQSSEQKERHTTNMVGGYTDAQRELHNKPITST